MRIAGVLAAFRGAGEPRARQLTAPAGPPEAARLGGPRSERVVQLAHPVRQLAAC